MQSIEILIVIAGKKHPDVGSGPAVWLLRFVADKKKKRRHVSIHCVRRPGPWPRQKRRLLVVFRLQDLATTVKAVRADVVTQVRFAGRRFDGQVRRNQEIVRTVHAALRWGLLVLLNSHDDS
jgi:hypothetical protein